MNKTRAKENANIRKGYRMRNLDMTARTDPTKSPRFHRTIARGMNACGFNKIGALSAGTVDVIFAMKTGDTEEIQRHRKFASAGHLNPDHR
jgi:hypothetical protein